MNNRFNIIVEIIKMSPEYTTGQVAYDRDNNGITVKSVNDSKLFLATSLVVRLNAFSTYFCYEDEQLILRVF